MQHRCKAILRNGFSNWILAVWFPRKQRKTVLFFLNRFLHHFRNFACLKWYHSIQRISSSRSYFFWPVTTDTGAGSEFHPATRSLALSRAEDLRAELLRAEHLKAEAVWEDSSRWAKTGTLFFFFFLVIAWMWETNIQAAFHFLKNKQRHAHYILESVWRA